MKYFTLVSALLCLTLPGGAVVADDTKVISTQYGVVERVLAVEEDSKHAGGAVAGGAVGAAVGPHGPKAHTGLRVAAGAAAGAAIQGAATGGTAYQYTVNLVNGGSATILTEQVDIREGDCVAVEQGETTAIRRVEANVCLAAQPASSKTSAAEAATSSTPAGSQSDSAGTSPCDIAKNELAAATTAESVDMAVKKVEILCE